MTIELCVWKITANKSLDRIAQHDQGLITFLKNRTCYVCDGKMRACTSYAPTIPETDAPLRKPHFLKSWAERKPALGCASKFYDEGEGDDNS